MKGIVQFGDEKRKFNTKKQLIDEIKWRMNHVIVIVTLHDCEKNWTCGEEYSYYHVFLSRDEALRIIK